MRSLIFTVVFLLSTICYGQRSLTFSSNNGSTILSSKPNTVEEDTPFVEVPTEPKQTVTPVVQPQQTVTVERFLVTSPDCYLCPAAKARFLASGGESKNIISRAQAKERFNRVVNGVPFEFTERVSTSVSVKVIKTTTKCSCSTQCTCGCQSGGECKCGSAKTTTKSVSQSISAHGKHLRDVHGIDPTGMSEDQIRAAHNRAHGGGNWTFPNETRQRSFSRRR